MEGRKSLSSKNSHILSFSAQKIFCYFPHRSSKCSDRALRNIDKSGFLIRDKKIVEYVDYKSAIIRSSRGLLNYVEIWLLSHVEIWLLSHVEICASLTSKTARYVLSQQMEGRKSLSSKIPYILTFSAQEIFCYFPH